MASWAAGKMAKPAFKQGFGYLQKHYPDSQVTAHVAQLATADNPMRPSEDEPFEVVGAHSPEPLSKQHKSVKERATGMVETRAKTYAINKVVGLIFNQLMLPLTVVLWVLKLVGGFIEDRHAASARSLKSLESHRADVERVVKQIKSRPAGSLLASKRAAVDGHMLRGADSKQVSGPASRLGSSAPEGSQQPSLHLIDLSRLNRVLSLDKSAATCVVEANCTFRDLLRVSLHSKLMPQVVPPFLDISVGGAFSGSAIGSTSWRKGAFPEGVVEVTVVLASGEVLTVAREGGHKSLFHALHSSFHTVASIVSLKLQLVDAPRYVWQRYEIFPSVEKAVSRLNAFLGAAAVPSVEHVEMLAFGPQAVTLCLNQGVERIDPSKHKVITFQHFWELPYYLYVQQITGRGQAPVKHCVPIMDFLSRYENGAFWQSSWMFKQLPWPVKGNSFVARLLLGWSMAAQNVRSTIECSDLHSQFERNRITQDAMVPLHHLAPFVQWELSALRVAPLWLCPVLGTPDDILAPNYQHASSESNSAHGFHFVNVGVYGRFASETLKDAESANESFVEHVYKAGGRTMLHSHNFHSSELWAKMYDRKSVDAVRRKYGSDEAYPSLFDKVALPEVERAELREPAASGGHVQHAMMREILSRKLKFWQ